MDSRKSNAMSRELDDMVDAAVERLLSSPASGILGELQKLRSENEQLKRSLEEVKRADDAELTRLWATIEDLEVKFAMSRQGQAKGERRLEPGADCNGALVLPGPGQQQPAAGNGAAGQAGAGSEEGALAANGMTDLGKQVAELSMQLQDTNLRLLQLSAGIAQQAAAAPKQQQEGGVANGEAGGGWPGPPLLGSRGLRAAIDSSIRAQLQEVLMPQLRAELWAALGATGQAQQVQQAQQAGPAGAAVATAAGASATPPLAAQPPPPPQQQQQQAEGDRGLPQPSSQEGHQPAEQQPQQQEEPNGSLASAPASSSPAVPLVPPAKAGTAAGEPLPPGKVEFSLNPGSKKQGSVFKAPPPLAMTGEPSLLAAAMDARKRQLGQAQQAQQEQGESGEGAAAAAAAEGTPQQQQKRQRSAWPTPVRLLDARSPPPPSQALQERQQGQGQPQQAKQQTPPPPALGSLLVVTTPQPAPPSEQQAQQQVSPAAEGSLQPNSSSILGKLLLGAGSGGSGQQQPPEEEQGPSADVGNAAATPPNSCPGEASTSPAPKEGTPPAYPSWLARREPERAPPSAIALPAAKRGRFAAELPRVSTEGEGVSQAGGGAAAENEAPECGGEELEMQLGAADYLDPGFMMGPIRDSMALADIPRLPFICPPCGCTLPSHQAYLEHLLSSEHLKRTALVLKGQKGVDLDAEANQEGMSPDLQVRHRVAQQHFYCHACARNLSSLDFLEHLLSQDHLQEARRGLAAPAPSAPSAPAPSAPAAPAGTAGDSAGAAVPSAPVPSAAAAATPSASAAPAVPAGDSAGAAAPQQTAAAAAGVAASGGEPGWREKAQPEPQPWQPPATGKLDYSDPSFMRGGFAKGSSKEALEQAERVCPPCGLLLPSHQAYLAHLLEEGHLLQARQVLEATLGAKKLPAADRKGRTRKLEEHYACWGCNRAIRFDGFLEHLLSTGHLANIRDQLVQGQLPPRQQAGQATQQGQQQPSSVEGLEVQGAGPPAGAEQRPGQSAASTLEPPGRVPAWEGEAEEGGELPQQGGEQQQQQGHGAEGQQAAGSAVGALSAGAEASLAAATAGAPTPSGEPGVAAGIAAPVEGQGASQSPAGEPSAAATKPPPGHPAGEVGGSSGQSSKVLGLRRLSGKPISPLAVASGGASPLARALGPAPIPGRATGGDTGPNEQSAATPAEPSGALPGAAAPALGDPMPEQDAGSLQPEPESVVKEEVAEEGAVAVPAAAPASVPAGPEEEGRTGAGAGFRQKRSADSELPRPPKRSPSADSAAAAVAEGDGEAGGQGQGTGAGGVLAAAEMEPALPAAAPAAEEQQQQQGLQPPAASEGGEAAGTGGALAMQAPTDEKPGVELRAGPKGPAAEEPMAAAPTPAASISFERPHSVAAAAAAAPPAAGGEKAPAPAPAEAGRERAAVEAAGRQSSNAGGGHTEGWGGVSLTDDECEEGELQPEEGELTQGIEGNEQQGKGLKQEIEETEEQVEDEEEDEEGEGEGEDGEDPDIDWASPDFMPGAVVKSLPWGELDALPRTCPPCGITLATHRDYLRHNLTPSHLQQAQRVLAALPVAGSRRREAAVANPAAARKILNQSYPCHACCRTIQCAGFLSHLLSQKHSNVVTAALRKIGGGARAAAQDQQGSAAGAAAAAVGASVGAVPAQQAQHAQQQGGGAKQGGQAQQKPSATSSPANGACPPVAKAAMPAGPQQPSLQQQGAGARDALAGQKRSAAAPSVHQQRAGPQKQSRWEASGAEGKGPGPVHDQRAPSSDLPGQKPPPPAHTPPPQPNPGGPQWSPVYRPMPSPQAGQGQPGGMPFASRPQMVPMPGTGPTQPAQGFIMQGILAPPQGGGSMLSMPSMPGPPQQWPGGKPPAPSGPPLAQLLGKPPPPQLQHAQQAQQPMQQGAVGLQQAAPGAQGLPAAPGGLQGGAMQFGGPAQQPQQHAGFQQQQGIGQAHPLPVPGAAKPPPPPGPAPPGTYAQQQQGLQQQAAGVFPGAQLPGAQTFGRALPGLLQQGQPCLPSMPQPQVHRAGEGGAIFAQSQTPPPQGGMFLAGHGPLQSLTMAGPGLSQPQPLQQQQWLGDAARAASLQGQAGPGLQTPVGLMAPPSQVQQQQQQLQQPPASIPLMGPLIGAQAGQAGQVPFTLAPPMGAQQAQQPAGQAGQLQYGMPAQQQGMVFAQPQQSLQAQGQQQQQGQQVFPGFTGPPHQQQTAHPGPGQLGPWQPQQPQQLQPQGLWQPPQQAQQPQAPWQQQAQWPQN